MTEYVFMNQAGTQIVVICRELQYWVLINRWGYVLPFAKYVQLLEKSGWTCLGTL